MDPTTLLADIRELIKVHEQGYIRSPVDLESWAGELAEKVADLDEWITRGGFLPAGWMPPRSRDDGTGYPVYAVEEAIL